MAHLLPHPVNPLVVQHNALVNAGFALSALEMRCFLALLGRIGREDTALPLCRIPVRELCADSTSKNIYQEVRAMTVALSRRSLLLEVLGPNGQRLPEPDIKARPLMGAIDYLKKEGVVEAIFNEHLRPYLLELKNNFTKAQLGQLLKLKRPAAHRIYWLLREYASFGQRTVSLDELRHVLGLEGQYADRFDHFRIRVLEPAREELAGTDLPFTYELHKQGRVITEITFRFPPAGRELPALPPLTGWEADVVAVGVAPASLEVVRSHLAAGDYDEGYVRYVLATVRGQVQAGKVKKEAGAVYRALDAAYLLPAYRKTQQPKAQPAAGLPRPAPAVLARQREKLSHALEDATRSREFILSHPGHAEQERTDRLQQVEAVLTDLQAKLQRLTG